MKTAKYEHVFIARPDLSSTQVDKLTTTCSETVKKNGGSVKKVEHWGLRQLAYPIKKSKKGHYVMLNIEAPGTTIHELERTMRLNEDVLRYLTVSVEEFLEGAAPVKEQKSGYPSGPREGGFGGRDSKPRYNRDGDKEAKADAAPESADKGDA